MNTSFLIFFIKKAKTCLKLQAILFDNVLKIMLLWSSSYEREIMWTLMELNISFQLKIPTMKNNMSQGWPQETWNIGVLVSSLWLDKVL